MSDSGLSLPEGAAAPAYAPREACQRALAELEGALASGETFLALCGPEGIGRTSVLRTLEARPSDVFRWVYLPYAALPAGELCAWVLGLLDEEAPGDPGEALVGAARRIASQGRSLVVLLDDAEVLPIVSAWRLASLAQVSAGSIRLVLVLPGDLRAERLREAFAGDLREVQLDTPLTQAESETLLEGLLEHWQTPSEVRRRFDAETIQRLHDASAGLPGRLHLLADEIVRGRASLPGVQAAAAPAPLEGESRTTAPDAGPALADVAPTADEPATPSASARATAAAAPVAPDPLAERNIAAAEGEAASPHAAPALHPEPGTTEAPAAVEPRLTLVEPVPVPAEPEVATERPSRAGDESFYIPRPATERVLGALERDLIDQQRRVLLVGPPGIGKTTLLRVLGQRLLSRFTPLHLPYPALAPDELCRFALTRLHASVVHENAQAFLGYASDLAEQGAPLALMIDDAAALPHESRVWLDDVLKSEACPFQVLLCCCDDERADSLRRDIGAGAPIHRLSEPMSEQETGDYLSGQLARVGAPSAVRESFDDAVVSEIHTKGGGVPAAVQHLADAILRSSAVLPAAGAGDSPSPTPEPAESGASASDRAESPADADATAGISGDAIDLPVSESPRDQAAEPDAFLGEAVPTSSETRLRALAVALSAVLAVAVAVLWLWPRDASGPQVEPPPARPQAAAAAAEGTDGSISVHINAVPWARVEIDDRDLGITPLANVRLEPGRHLLRARLPDGRIIEREVQIDASHRHLLIEP